jgi:hypothetical protein
VLRASERNANGLPGDRFERRTTTIHTEHVADRVPGVLRRARDPADPTRSVRKDPTVGLDRHRSDLDRLSLGAADGQ